MNRYCVKNSLITALFLLAFPAGNFANAQQDTIVKLPGSEVKHPEWSKNAAIYEVNIRQYTNEGTFKAFEKDLPRLKAMGIEILWMMPVHPIGAIGRKGKLGSYYAVKDYKAINPEFGTMDDFKHLVKSVHANGLKVIIDWVPNHTSLDNDLLIQHPEYYLKDSAGKLVSPFDWTDVYRLDYTKKVTRSYMTETMKWWLTETDIDGFRCDVAHMMPTDYWGELRPQLDQVKTVFMLAESDIPAQQVKGFDMSYDWKFHHIMNDIAKGKKNATAILKHFAWMKKAYPANAYVMEFTSNHDENTWAGSEYERLGNGAQTFAVVAATVGGMPLVYTGQESAFARRLRFFDKDTIPWTVYPLESFYKTLFSLKIRNHALWNGNEGGDAIVIVNENEKNVISFYRQKDAAQVVVICNLTDKEQAVSFSGMDITGTFLNVFNLEHKVFASKNQVKLAPWQYLVYEKLK